MQVSLWNFVKYNVIGGGQSALYGVEGPAYYLHNGVLAFNLALPLALALPLLAALQRFCCRKSDAAAPTGSSRQSSDPASAAKMPPRHSSGAGQGLGQGGPLREWLRVVAALSPLWLWLAAISVLPHKEERFLYVVYPLVSLTQVCTTLTGVLCINRKQTTKHTYDWP